MSELRETINRRRSIYEIGRNTEYTVNDVVEALREVVTALPSATNSQSTRWVVVSGEKNDQIWDMIHEDQKGALSEKMYAFYEPRFTQAKNGLGTILLFESREAVASMPVSEARSHRYKENNHGISALATWLLLREMGLGTSLQHFNIGYEQGFDKRIREALGLPEDWEMVAQMPFGSIEEEPAAKDKVAAEERVLSIS